MIELKPTIPKKDTFCQCFIDNCSTNMIYIKYNYVNNYCNKKDKK